MSDHRRISDSPYNEEEYLGIRPPQPKMRSHHDARSRHRSRSAGRRPGKEGSDVGDWDRHQDVMRRERKRLREKKELSRRAQELFQEEHRRQSSALCGGQRPRSMAQMPPQTGSGLSSVSTSKRSGGGGGGGGGGSGNHRHRHRKGSPSRSGSSCGAGEADRRKHGKRHRRHSEESPMRERSRSPLRSQIAAAVPLKGQVRRKDREAVRGSRSRRRHEEKDRGSGRRRSFSSSSSSSSTSRSSSASEESCEVVGERRRPAQERHRKKKAGEDELEDIALLTEPDVGIGEELDDEVEEGEAGSDAGSSLEHDRGDREEGEHEEEEEEEEEEEAQSGGRGYVHPGKSKFDSPSSSSSSSTSVSRSGSAERRRGSSEDEEEEEEEGEEPEEDEEENSSEEERRGRPRIKDASQRSDDSSDDQEMAGASSEEEEEEEEERTDGPSAREEEERRKSMERERRRLDKPWYLPSVLGCRSVEEFSCLNRIEEGTYGVVYRARDKKTEEVVALKRLKMEKEREGFPITSLREINTLLKAQHPNIVTVREIVVGSNMDKIYIVMGYVEHDLKSLMEVMKEPFMIGEVKTLMMQLLSAVAHLHDNWILHRDLKTSNLLLSHKGVLKVGDFGLAREYGSPLRRYTPVVVTLWYRAVELLLGAKLYSTAVDMWSVGCIFAELLLMKALFPGKGEANQLNLIFRELGTPNERIWPNFSSLPLAKKMVTDTHYQFNSLRKRFPDNVLSDLGFDLMNKLLTYSPERRISADDALKHSYFTEKPHPISPHLFPTWPAKSEGAVVHHKKRASPKPPSGGLAYSKIVASSEKEVPEGLGFRLTGDANAAQDKGFRLKF